MVSTIRGFGRWVVPAAIAAVFAFVTSSGVGLAQSEGEEHSAASGLSVSSPAPVVEGGVSGVFVLEWTKGTHPSQTEEIIHWRKEGEEYSPESSRLVYDQRNEDGTRRVRTTDLRVLFSPEQGSSWSDHDLEPGETYILQISSHYCLTCPMPLLIGDRVEYGRSNEVTITTPESGPGGQNAPPNPAPQIDPTDPAPTDVEFESTEPPVVLTWEPGVSDTDEPYVEQRILRRVVGVSGQGWTIRTVGVNASRFMETEELQAGNTYRYRIAGFRADGSRGPLGPKMDVEIEEQTGPPLFVSDGPRPDYVTFESPTFPLVLIWRPGVSDTDEPYVSQEIWRRVVGVSGEGWTIRTVEADVTRFVETDELRRETKTTYRYRVRGVRADGSKGPLSNRADVRVLPARTWEYDEYGRRVPKE